LCDWYWIHWYCWWIFLLGVVNFRWKHWEALKEVSSNAFMIVIRSKLDKLPEDSRFFWRRISECSEIWDK
jgi:hypothetical protein